MGSAPNIDISPADLEVVTDILWRYVPGEAVWAFGSRVSGTAKEHSDLDLAIDGDEPLSLRKLGALSAAFDASDLSFKVDIVDWATASPEFREVIKKNRALLQPAIKGGGIRERAGGGWRDCLWGDIAILQYGKGLRGYKDAPGPVRVFGTNGPIGWHTKALCEHPTVIVGRKGAYRGIHYSPDPCFVIDTAFFLEPRGDLDMRWAYYELLTHDINAMDSGSAIPSTSRDAFYRLPVAVPPLPEQHAIAHILSTLDDKIELNRRMNETLEAMARALFKSWFVDFDPVRAKAEGRQPEGMDAETAALFPDGFEDSESGEIPRGWGVGNVGEVAELSRGGLNPSEFPDETFDHFSIPAFDEGRKPKRELGASIKSNKFLVPSDAVLLSKLNPRIPRVWVPNVRGEYRAICSTEFLVTVPRTGISREFLFCFLSSEAFAGAFGTLVTGTSGSHQRVRPESFLSMPAIIPDGPTISRFSAEVRPLLARVGHARDEAATLAEIRGTLLPKLISGEIRVPEVDQTTGKTGA